MSLYLSRPVFDFSVNWAEVPKFRYNYALNEVSLAFALPQYERIQKHTTQGIEFAMTLHTEAELVAWLNFVEAVKGRLAGFWFPSPFEQLIIEPGFSSASEIRVKHSNLKQWVADHPSTHLAFCKDGEAPVYAQIKEVDGVLEFVDGRERVQFETALGVEIDSSWYCTKLLYVRLDSNDESLELAAESYAITKVKVIELPNEYAELETGQIPVYLYEWFQVRGPSNIKFWRQTGLNESITSNGQLFHSFPVTHSELIRSMRADFIPDLRVKSWYRDDGPLSQFIPFKSPAPLWLRLYEATFATPDVRQTIFTGKVVSVRNKGKALEATLATFLDAFGRKYPRFYLQPRCNYVLNDQNCRAPVREAGGSVTNIQGRQVTFTPSDPPYAGQPESKDFNFFALGWCYTGSGDTYETRSVRQSGVMTAGQMTLRLDRPFEFAHVGSVLQVIAGCNGDKTDCERKHFNFANFGGHNLPQDNPTVVAITPAAPSGNKK